MAYKQRSNDIKEMMVGMKSSLNYGGKSALMKLGDDKKEEKDDFEIKTASYPEFTLEVDKEGRYEGTSMDKYSTKKITSPSM
jgi:hypothetical protein